MRSGEIAVVEPQMRNLFHSPFNAALLHAIVLGFPEAGVSFAAMPGHLAAVREILGEHAPEVVERVEWRELEETAGDGTIARWRSNRRILREALRGAGRVVFCSVSRMQLLQLKRMMTERDEVLAVLHGDLERVLEPETEGFPGSVFSLRRVLGMAQPRGLRYVVLGESIRRNLPEEFAEAFRSGVVIDHPYHFAAVDLEGDAVGDGRQVFGIFGNCGDGRELERVVRSVKAGDAGVRFRLVGFVADEAAVRRLEPLVEGVGTEPLARDEFVRRAREIDYALWLTSAGSFKLRASGTFFDALSFAKPMVYVGNAYLDGYLRGEADGAARRCESEGDVAAAILRIAAERDRAKYRMAREAMMRLRERFRPEVLAKELPGKFGW